MDAWRDTHMSIVTTFLKQEYAGSGRPSPIENHSPEEACQSLEFLCAEELQSVRSLQEKIAQKRAISNLLVRFACFPTEIFCEVVSYLLKPGKPPGPDFLNAISTCRRWRQAATSNPSFWTHICLNNPTLAKASVERTRDRGIHIVLQDAKCDIDAAVAVLTPHAYRIQSIEVRHSSALVIANFFDKMNVAAPNLHSLTIHATRASFDRLVIPSVFAGETPSLRRLELDNVVPSTTSLSTLVQLHLRNTSLSLPAMLALLDPCTHLQTLAIYGYHLWGDGDQVGAERVVNLPSLRELLLDTQPIAHSDLLLSHIALPESALLRIAVDNMVDEDFALPDLAALSHRLPCTTGIRQLELTWDDTTQTAYLRGSRSSDSAQKQQHLVPAVEIAVHGAEWLLDAVPADDLPIDTSAVEVLIVNSGAADGAQGPGFTQWPDLLQHLPSVKTLHLREPNTQTAASLLRALSESRIVPLGTMPVPPHAGTFMLAFCPALAGLEMRGFAWHADIERELVGMLKERWRAAQGVLREVRVGHARGVVDGRMAFPGDGSDAPVQLFFSSAA